MSWATPSKPSIGEDRRPHSTRAIDPRLDGWCLFEDPARCDIAVSTGTPK